MTTLILTPATAGTGIIPRYRLVHGPNLGIALCFVIQKALAKIEQMQTPARLRSIQRIGLIPKVIFIYVTSAVFFLIYIQFPTKPNHDEFHYVPAARRYLAGLTNVNYEHPPLGKLLMAVGIGVAGDNPLGWRIMSVLFGSLTLVAVYALARILFRRDSVAFWVTLVTLFNQMLYVQSRIGMLDPFMFAFLMLSMLSFAWSWEEGLGVGQLRLRFALTGFFIGCASACKWVGLVSYLATLGWVGAVVALQTLIPHLQHPLALKARDWLVGTRVHPQLQKSPVWFRLDLWRPMRWWDWLFTLGVIPILTYCATFIPLMCVDPAYSVASLWSVQKMMYDGQLRVITAHPYMSQWTQWPLLTRPIWYLFETLGEEKQYCRGILLLGNPLVMWAGLAALPICLFDFIRSRRLAPFFITFFYALFYFSWAVIPRKILFFNYYYPAAMVLSYALAQAFLVLERSFPQPYVRSWKWAFLGGSLVLFIYFFPITAHLRLPADGFRRYMWSPRWV